MWHIKSQEQRDEKHFFRLWINLWIQNKIIIVWISICWHYRRAGRFSLRFISPNLNDRNQFFFLISMLLQRIDVVRLESAANTRHRLIIIYYPNIICCCCCCLYFLSSNKWTFYNLLWFPLNDLFIPSPVSSIIRSKRAQKKTTKLPNLWNLHSTEWRLERTDEWRRRNPPLSRFHNVHV